MEVFVVEEVARGASRDVPEGRVEPALEVFVGADHDGMRPDERGSSLGGMPSRVRISASAEQAAADRSGTEEAGASDSWRGGAKSGVLELSVPEDDQKPAALRVAAHSRFESGLQTRSTSGCEGLAAAHSQTSPQASQHFAG